MDAFTPAQTTELVSRIGCKKATQRKDKLFFNSVLAGMLLSFGCALALSTEVAPWFQTNAPGLIRTIGAMFFPVGLTMIVLTGADLITSNFMFMGTALLHRRCTILDLVINWVISFLGNLAGALFFMAIITGYGGTWDGAAYKSYALTFATGKVVTPQWHQIFLRGIGCNWLVCMAVFLSISSREIFSKILSIYLPVMCFVGLGFDHVVANMYFIPNAIFLGHPDITVGLYIWKSMIPSLIGNAIGGFLFMSVPYYYLYLTGSEGVKIHFDIGMVNSAMEAGGPLGPVNHQMTNGASNEPKEDERVVVSSATGDSSPDSHSQLPDSSSMARSGLAHEMNASLYTKKRYNGSPA